MSDKIWDFLLLTIWGGIIFIIIGIIFLRIEIKELKEPYHQSKIRGWAGAIGSVLFGIFIIINQFFGFYKNEEPLKTFSTSFNSIAMLKVFKNKEKFVANSMIGYSGIYDYRKEIFSEIINHCTDNLIEDIENDRNKAVFYREIEICLSAFNLYEVNSEDSLIIKAYMQELLNIVGIKDDDGIFERWAEEDLTVSMKYIN